MLMTRHLPGRLGEGALFKQNSVNEVRHHICEKAAWYIRHKPGGQWVGKCKVRK